MTDRHTPAGIPTPAGLPEANLPAQHWPLPEITTFEDHPHPTASMYQKVQASEKFQRLRTAFRGFAFPTVAAVVVWYLLYVILSVVAEPGKPSIMGTKVLGNITMGMLIGLLQFPTTWIATWYYTRRMATKIDPMATELREQIEGEVAA
ncbi:MAG TPA: DUF485 domain-containing protein [Propionicimonas sp.]|nr:DUF485 domain-containing protein [Propionicimonas sp.]